MMELALLPQLTYDELTVALSALAQQATGDIETLRLADSPEIRELLQARLRITQSLVTAFAEARMTVERPEEDGPLEPLRVTLEQPGALAPVYSGGPRGL